MPSFLLTSGEHYGEKLTLYRQMEKLKWSTGAYETHSDVLLGTIQKGERLSCPYQNCLQLFHQQYYSKLSISDRLWNQASKYARFDYFATSTQCSSLKVKEIVEFMQRLHEEIGRKIEAFNAKYMTMILIPKLECSLKKDILHVPVPSCMTRKLAFDKC